MILALVLSLSAALPVPTEPPSIDSRSMEVLWQDCHADCSPDTYSCISKLHAIASTEWGTMERYDAAASAVLAVCSERGMKPPADLPPNMMGSEYRDESINEVEIAICFAELGRLINRYNSFCRNRYGSDCLKASTVQAVSQAQYAWARYAVLQSGNPLPIYSSAAAYDAWVLEVDGRWIMQ